MPTYYQMEDDPTIPRAIIFPEVEEQVKNVPLFTGDISLFEDSDEFSLETNQDEDDQDLEFFDDEYEDEDEDDYFEDEYEEDDWTFEDDEDEDDEDL